MNMLQNNVPTQVQSTPESSPPPLWSGKEVAGMGGIAIALLALVLLPAIFLLRGSIASITTPAGSQAVLYLNMVGLAAEAIGLIGAVGWMGLRRRHLTWQDLGFKRIEGLWLIISPALTFGTAIVGGVAALVVQRLLQTPGGNAQAQALAPAGFSWFGLIGMTLLGGVIVPIAEEIYFRGVLHRWARDKWGVLIGSLISSLLFGLIHGIPPVIAFAFIMGLTIAYAYEKTQSLWPGIIIHVINNSFKIVLLYLFVANGFAP